MRAALQQTTKLHKAAPQAKRARDGASSVMGACLGSCIASAACTACCYACSCKCETSRTIANWIYVGLLVVGALLALALRYAEIDLNYSAAAGIGRSSSCDRAAGEDCDHFVYDICNAHDQSCAGYWAVYRVSFVLAALYGVLMVLTSCASSFAVYVHRGFWYAKALGLAGVFVGALFAPNEFFAYYAWIARVVSPVFLVYQLIVYIDVGYTLNRRLCDLDDQVPPARLPAYPWGCPNESGYAYRKLMLALSLLLIVGALTALGCLYAWYPPSCAFNATAVTTTLLFGLLNTALAVSPVAEHGSLFVSALLFAYTTWLCYATLAAFPEATCNPFLTDWGSELGWMLASCVVTALTVGYLAFKLGRRQMGANAMTGKEPPPAKEPPLPPPPPPPSASRATTATAHDEVTVHVPSHGGAVGVGVDALPAPPPPGAFGGYHGVMLLTALYTAMLLTDWGVPGASGGQSRHNVGYASAWLQMGANWLCSALYGWTLVAARACPHRDFSG